MRAAGESNRKVALEKTEAAMSDEMKAGEHCACEFCKACGMDWEHPDGNCPICGHTEYIKIGKAEFGICPTHKVWWRIGWNNISTHWMMPLNHMRQNAIDAHGYQKVGDPECIWDAAIAAKAVEEWFEGFIQSAMRATPSLTREQLADIPINEMVLAEDEDEPVPETKVLEWPDNGNDIPF